MLERVQSRATKKGKGSGTSLLWGKAARAEAVYPGEEKAQRDLISVYKYLRVHTGWRQVVFSGAW